MEIFLLVQGTHENLLHNKIYIFSMEKILHILYTLHAQAVMASIEHVHRRACCVCGSVLANFETKTTILLIHSMHLLATADRVLATRLACAIAGEGVWGGECPYRIR